MKKYFEDKMSSAQQKAKQEIDKLKKLKSVSPNKKKGGTSNISLEKVHKQVEDLTEEVTSLKNQKVKTELKLDEQKKYI